MHFMCAAVLALASLTVATPLSIADPNDNGILHPRQALRRHPYCRPHGGVHIIAASGAGAPQVRGYGLLQTLVDSIREKIPGTTNYSIPFEKTTDPTLAPKAVAGGVSLMTENIKWYADGCPNTPIILLGYSQGAIITGNTLCGRSIAGVLPYGAPLDSKYAKNIMATILYGDETYNSGMSYDMGTCKVGKGFLPRANPSGCDAFAHSFHSYCDINDPHCCVGSPNPDPNIHYVYPDKYDAAVTSWVQTRYSSWT